MHSFLCRLLIYLASLTPLLISRGYFELLLFTPLCNDCTSSETRNGAHNTIRRVGRVVPPFIAWLLV